MCLCTCVCVCVCVRACVRVSECVRAFMRGGGCVLVCAAGLPLHVCTAWPKESTTSAVDTGIAPRFPRVESYQ